MKPVRIEGELYVTLEIVADCYRVESAWLRRVYELGLLGQGRVRDTQLVISARRLDRVARIVQLHFHHGVSLELLDAVL